MGFKARGQAALEHFKRSVRKHELVVVRDDELHRHLNLRRSISVKTGDRLRIDIVTWPEALCISSEKGTYVFSARGVKDMFTVFRPAPLATAATPPALISPGRWANLLLSESTHQPAREFDGPAFWGQAVGMADDYAQEAALPAQEHQLLLEALKKQVGCHCAESGSEQKARAAAEQFEWFEFNLRGLTPVWRFPDHWLWTCYAIPWAIARYDQERQTDV